PAAVDLVRLVARAAGVPALLADVRGLLLQPRRAVAARGSDQLQAPGVPRARGRAGHRARPTGRHPAALLADGYLDLEKLLGLRRQPGLQDGWGDHRRSGRYRQQERLPAAEHRAAPRWD